MKKIVLNLFKYKFIVCKMIIQIIIFSGALFGYHLLSCISTLLGFYFLFFCNDQWLWMNSILIIQFNIFNWTLLTNKNLNNILTFMPVNVGILIFTFNNIMKQENGYSLFFLITSLTTQVMVLCYNFNLIGYLYSKESENIKRVVSSNSFIDLEDKKGCKEIETKIVITDKDNDWGYFVDTEN